MSREVQREEDVLSLLSREVRREEDVGYCPWCQVFQVKKPREVQREEDVLSLVSREG